MKANSTLQITKKEAVMFALVMTWIIASIFVPLPEVNSLGV
jgi:hypothetical protein